MQRVYTLHPFSPLLSGMPLVTKAYKANRAKPTKINQKTSVSNPNP